MSLHTKVDILNSLQRHFSIVIVGVFVYIETSVLHTRVGFCVLK